MPTNEHPHDHASHEATPCEPGPSALPTPTEITERLRQHLAQLPKGDCMFCGSSKDWRPYAWGQVLIYSGPGLDAGVTAALPTLVLECAACGFTASMNARTAGVLPP